MCKSLIKHSINSLYISNLLPLLVYISRVIGIRVGVVVHREKESMLDYDTYKCYRGKYYSTYFTISLYTSILILSYSLLPLGYSTNPNLHTH